MQYKYLNDFFNLIVKDEDLIRLLTYKPNSILDDPLSPSKPNITGTSKVHALVKESIIRAPKSTDLSQKQICRICMYLGYNTIGKPTNSAKVFNQDVVFDIYTNIDSYEAIDCRSLKIVDRLNELLNEERTTGIGRTMGVKVYPIPDAPEGYMGYKMIFTFGGTK